MTITVCTFHRRRRKQPSSRKPATDQGCTHASHYLLGDGLGCNGPTGSGKLGGSSPAGQGQPRRPPATSCSCIQPWLVSDSRLNRNIVRKRFPHSETPQIKASGCILATKPGLIKSRDKVVSSTREGTTPHLVTIMSLSTQAPYKAHDLHSIHILRNYVEG